MIIYGFNPVLEALRAGRAVRLRVVRQRHDQRMQQVLQSAADAGVPVEYTEARDLERAARGGLHQGVLAEVREQAEYAVGDLVAAANVPLIVVLDGVEDPHNFGAILRVADAAGADGVVRQSRRAASLDGVAAKASAGAIAHARIATVVNIARALEELQAAGVWTVGLAGDAKQRYSELDLRLPTALVLGAEGSGLRRLVRERCDVLASIPMKGHVESVNVSVAAGIVLFEAVRQREGR